MSVTWTKADNGVIVNRADNVRFCLTVAELQEGLRIATEKPVFEGISIDGSILQFQNRDTVVMYRAGDHQWCSVAALTIGALSDSCLEAILQAGRS